MRPWWCCSSCGITSLLGRPAIPGPDTEDPATCATCRFAFAASLSRLLFLRWYRRRVIRLGEATL